MESILNIEDSFLTAEEMETLFKEDANLETPPDDNTGEKNTSEEDNNDKDETTEDEVIKDITTPESVGSEEDNQEKEDAQTTLDGSSSKFYSSITKALVEEGIFPDLDNESIDKVNTPEDFRDIIEKQIQSKFDERQKRIDEALNAGVESSEISKYENTIQYLKGIEEDKLTSEGEEGETLRKRLIYQDFVNRGYSQERALREVTKSFNAGTDIEDAKEALKSNIDYFNDAYNNVISEAKAEELKFEEERKKRAEQLKTSILNDDKYFGDLNVDKSTRQKIYDNIAKPIYKDPETGDLYTAIQKYEKENSVDFLKNVSILFTLTNGFKNIDSLVKGKVKKEVSKGLKNLENTLNNTSRAADGSLSFASGVADDDSFIGSGWQLDV